MPILVLNEQRLDFEVGYCGWTVLEIVQSGAVVLIPVRLHCYFVNLLLQQLVVYAPCRRLVIQRFDDFRIGVGAVFYFGSDGVRVVLVALLDFGDKGAGSLRVYGMSSLYLCHAIRPPLVWSPTGRRASARP